MVHVTGRLERRARVTVLVIPVVIKDPYLVSFPDHFFRFCFFQPSPNKNGKSGVGTPTALLRISKSFQRIRKAQNEKRDPYL